MNRWYWRTLAGIAAFGVVVAIVLVLLPKPPISSKIQRQLTFTLLLPTNSQFAVEPGSVTYNTKLKLLNFNTSAFGKTVTISEQPTPQTFTDVPAVYDKVVSGMNDYMDFDVNVGTVHLTTPAQLNGKQAAVFNGKGTLLFAKPSGSLTNDQWRQYFIGLEVVQ